MPAGVACDANIRAEPHDGPFKPAARVRFAEPHHIGQRNIEGHTWGL